MKSTCLCLVSVWFYTWLCKNIWMILQFVLCFFEYVFTALFSGHCICFCSHLHVQTSFWVVMGFLNSCIPSQCSATVMCGNMGYSVDPHIHCILVLWQTVVCQSSCAHTCHQSWLWGSSAYFTIIAVGFPHEPCWWEWGLSGDSLIWI